MRKIFIKTLFYFVPVTLGVFVLIKNKKQR